MLADRNPDRLRHRFAAAHFSKSLAWSFVDLLLAYYLHAVIGISTNATAWLLFALLLLGAVWNIAVGLIIDLLRTRPRVVLGTHFAGAVMTAVALFALFGSPLRSRSLIVAAGLFFRFAFALYDVPQTTLTSLLPTDDVDARTYVRLRTALAAAARLVVTLATLALARPSEVLFRSGAYPMLGVLSILIVGTAATLLVGDVDRVATKPHSLLRLTPPPGALRLLLAFALSVALLPILSRLLIFVPSRASSPRLGAWLLFAFTGGSVFGPLIAARTREILGWRRAWIGSIALTVLSGALLACVLRQSTGLVIAAAALHGVGLGLTGAFEWERASLLIRTYASETGRRTDGIMFGLIIFTIQVSVAGGSLLLGALLDDFVAGGVRSTLVILSTLALSGTAVALLLLNQRTGVEAA